MAAEAATDPLTADIHIARRGAVESCVASREVLHRSIVTPSGLRRFVRERVGLDTYLLHDGGLGLGCTHGTVVLEERPRSRDDRSVRGGVPVPPAARPWQRPGWHEDVLAWCRDEPTASNAGLSGDVTQVSTLDLGCVLRIGTSDGDLYLKANETPHEARVTRHLAALHPDLVPHVLATDETRHLLLTLDAGTSLHLHPEPEAWDEAVTKLARLHRDLDPDALIDLLLPAHPITNLPHRVRTLLLDEIALHDWGLPAETIGDLATIVPRLETAIARIAALDLPPVVLHGDAHPMNALTGQDAIVWFDWHEAATGHPFIDIGWFLAWLSHPARARLPARIVDPALPQRLWRTYLNALGLDASERLLDDAILLGLAHRATLFDTRFRRWRGTVPGWRPKYTPYTLRWLRKLAKSRAT